MIQFLNKIKEHIRSFKEICAHGGVRGLPKDSINEFFKFKLTWNNIFAILTNSGEPRIGRRVYLDGFSSNMQQILRRLHWVAPITSCIIITYILIASVEITHEEFYQQSAEGFKKYFLFSWEVIHAPHRFVEDMAFYAEEVVTPTGEYLYSQLCLGPLIKIFSCLSIVILISLVMVHQTNSGRVNTVMDYAIIGTFLFVWMLFIASLWFTLFYLYAMSTELRSSGLLSYAAFPNNSFFSQHLFLRNDWCWHVHVECHRKLEAPVFSISGSSFYPRMGLNIISTRMTLRLPDFVPYEHGDFWLKYTVSGFILKLVISLTVFLIISNTGWSKVVKDPITQREYIFFKTCFLRIIVIFILIHIPFYIIF